MSIDPPSADTLLALVRIARAVLEAWPHDRPVPPNLVKPLFTFYDLTNCHGIAPLEAPHIPDDGQI